MDSAVKIEPRFENPDGKMPVAGASATSGIVPESVHTAAPAAGAPAFMTMQWVYQNGYLLAGLGILIILVCFGIFWFRRPAVQPVQPIVAQSTPAQQNNHAPSATPADQQALQPPIQPLADAHAPAHTPASAQAHAPAHTPASTQAPQMTPETPESLRNKLDALNAARQQSERQPIVDVPQNDLDALMEDPSKKPEQQDLSIGALI